MSETRTSPIHMSKDEFKSNGHKLIDDIAEFIYNISSRPVTTGESPAQLSAVVGNASLPENGVETEHVLTNASDLLFRHSLFNGHPKFFGYITSSAAPLGALADLLASAVNPNVGANILSPMATEIEKQTVQWLAEFIGVKGYGGLLVSGGNMANFTAFLAARTAKAPKTIKEIGITGTDMQLLVYCSKATHTWIEKAAFLFGIGLNAIRWIDTTEGNKLNVSLLEQTVEQDFANGYKPFMVIANAGDVSTGAVDDLQAVGEVCKKFGLWLHVDGAYGIPAAVLPECTPLFTGIENADSIALDPHKWLYSPLEAGCTLVKDPNHLLETFSSHPVYYNFSSNEPQVQNYYEYGLQNSRGFRALKVWTTLQQVGRKGYIDLIREDIRLSKLLFTLAKAHPELEAMTQQLSITTLRYVPKDIHLAADDPYLDELNQTLLNNLQHNGQVFLSNALVNGRYCLRACIVNFRTTERDIKETVDIIVEEGRALHKK